MTALRLGSAAPSLIRWGLSPDADLVFRALDLEPLQSASTLARSLGLAQRRVEAALEELASVNLAAAGRDRVPSWTVCTPQKAVLTLRRRRLGRPAPEEQARRFVAAVCGLQVPTGPEGGSRTVRHLPATQVGPRIAALLQLERHEHLTMQPDRVLTRDVLDAGLRHDRALLDRGVRLRIVGRPPEDGDRGCPPTGDGPDPEYRETDDAPLRLMLFDRRVALVSAGPDRADGALEIADPELVRKVLGFFEQRWHTAVDPARTGLPVLVLTPRQRAVVDALARGLTDEEVATLLHVGTRTVGYTVRALMDLAGVENRFQLGLVLGAAGTTAVHHDRARRDLSA